MKFIMTVIIFLILTKIDPKIYKLFFPLSLDMNGINGGCPSDTMMTLYTILFLFLYIM